MRADKPEGRQGVIAEVVRVEYKRSTLRQGRWVVMTVRHKTGWYAKGTAPYAIADVVKKGDRVAFQASFNSNWNTIDGCIPFKNPSHSAQILKPQEV